MADVFVSYAREESARADQVRRALEALGLAVFFDVERLDAGDEWSDVLDRELKSAGAVVALWSPHALSRPWVRKECALAQTRGVLLPTLLEPVSDLDMPVQFSGLQRVDLADFHGQPDHAGWRKLVRALAKTLKRNDLLAAQIEALKEEKQTAKVKAELEAAQSELAKLRKSKGGVKPSFIVAGLALLMAVVGAGAWWAVGEMGRREAIASQQARASVVTPAVEEALRKIAPGPLVFNYSRQRLEQMLKTVTLDQLIKAAAVDANAALLVGRAYMDGAGGVTRNPQTAFGYFKQSCDAGNAVACDNVGVAYESGVGAPKDLDMAVRVYDSACEHGEMSACSSRGVMHLAGEGGPINPELGIGLLRKSCGGGDPFGCANLAHVYQAGDVLPKSLAEAEKLLVKGCDLGAGAICFEAGLLYDGDSGAPTDQAKAQSLYERACDFKLGYGCARRGYAFDEGVTVAKSETTAASYFQRACDYGDAGGCMSLSFKFQTGQGVSEDDGKAQTLRQRACDLGDKLACETR